MTLAPNQTISKSSTNEWVPCKKATKVVSTISGPSWLQVFYSTVETGFTLPSIFGET